MNSLSKKIFWIVFLGGLWGVSETFLGEYLFKNKFLFSSAILCIIGLFLIFFARKLIEFPHSGFLMGILTGIIKVSAQGPSSHIWAIILLGLYFDLFYDLFDWQRGRILERFGAVFSIFFLVSVTMALLSVGNWDTHYLKKLLNYVIINGSIASLIFSTVSSLFR